MKVVFDVECYTDYWLICLQDIDTGNQWAYELCDDVPLDKGALLWFVNNAQLIGFNSTHYDMPMIGAALCGYNNRELKQISNAIIQGNRRYWQIEREFGFRVPSCDHVDIFELPPGVSVSLKLYGGRMHSRRLQDLPIEHDAMIAPDQRPIVRSYCLNDLSTTLDLYRRVLPALQLREAMGAQYGLDLRSKSDAQIAEAVVKYITGAQKPASLAGHTFTLQVPAWVSYITPELNNVLRVVSSSVFSVTADDRVTMPPELEKLSIAIGQSRYKLGIGGIHSQEANRAIVAGDGYLLRDIDVTSYYPKLILNSGRYPPSVGPVFRQIYQQFYDERVAAKAAGNKAEADTKKIVLNGTFGKTGSRYSIFYSPELLIHTTLPGQLAILMLIERLELAGIPVVSANTDGIVTHIHQAHEPLVAAIVADWERETDLTTETTDYRALYSQSVNSYLAIKTDGKIKTKGLMALPTDPYGALAVTPAADVSTRAAVRYLTDGVPVAQTIRECTDIREFVVVRNVTGGGHYNGQQVRDGKLKWVEGGEPLGRAVRWYYAAGELRYIMTSKGDKVAGSDGARPIMTLPDTLPADIDYAKYETIARGILLDCGVVI